MAADVGVLNKRIEEGRPKTRNLRGLPGSTPEMPNPRGSAGSSPATEVRKTFVGQQARHVPFQVGLRTRRAGTWCAQRQMVKKPSLRCAALPYALDCLRRLPGSPRLLGVSDSAALEPAWIGRLRAGSPEMPVSRGIWGLLRRGRSLPALRVERVGGARRAERL